MLHIRPLSVRDFCYFPVRPATSLEPVQEYFVAIGASRYSAFANLQELEEIHFKTKIQIHIVALKQTVFCYDPKTDFDSPLSGRRSIVKT
jgi:hypothetical protein